MNTKLIADKLKFLKLLETKEYGNQKLQVFKQKKNAKFWNIFKEALDFQGHTNLRSLCLMDVGNNHMAGSHLLDYVKRNGELFEKGRTMFLSKQGEEFTVICVHAFKSSQIRLSFFEFFADNHLILKNDSYRIIVHLK